MTWWQRVLLGLLLLAHLTLLWLLVSSRPDGELHVGTTMGVFFGQGILVSLWLVCFRDSRWSRGLCVLLLAAAMWLVVAAGIDVLEPLSLTDMFLVGLAIVLCLLAFSGVFYVAWRIARWEIRSPDDDGSTSRQFSLRRSLIMVAVACVVLAVTRQVMPPLNPNAWADFAKLGRQLPLLCLGSAIAFIVLVVNGCVMLPVIAVMFCLKEHRWLSTVALLLFGVPIYGIVAFTMESLLLLPWLPANDPALAWILLVLSTVQPFTIILSLALLQAIGFCFERAPRRAKLPPGGGGERLHEAGSPSTIATAGETSPLATDR